MIESFINHLKHEKRYSKHTIIAYVKDLSQFAAFIKGIYNVVSIAEATHTHIRSWMVELMNKGISPRSINRKLSSLRAFFYYHNRLGNLTIDPTLKLQALKIAKKLPSIIQESNLESIFSKEPNGSSFELLRDRLIVDLLYSTGIRRSELINLKVLDIDKSYRQLKVLGKGNKERIIPVSMTLIHRIELYLEVRADHFDQKMSLEDPSYLLVTNKGKIMYPKFVYNIVTKYIESVSTSTKRSPHILRHSFATHLMNNGADLNAVKELLGHSSLSATQVYTHNSIEKLKDIYKIAHPKAKR